MSSECPLYLCDLRPDRSILGNHWRGAGARPGVDCFSCSQRSLVACSSSSRSGTLPNKISHYFSPQNIIHQHTSLSCRTTIISKHKEGPISQPQGVDSRVNTVVCGTKQRRGKRDHITKKQSPILSNALTLQFVHTNCPFNLTRPQIVS